MSLTSSISAAIEDTLMLDFDGTLAPFSTQRDAVRPYPGVMELLDQIADRQTHIVFVSGRPCKELRRLLGFQRWSALWGEHGLERMLPNGDVQTYAPAEDSLERRNLVAVLKDLIGSEHIEEKNAGLAIHWRGMLADRAERLQHVLGDLVAECVSSGEARLLPFADGMEIRFTRRTKGDAVREHIRTLSERAELAYLGDDLTDEDAFEAMNGRGHTVLVRAEFRPTKAREWVRPPEGLLQFLREWRDRRPA